MVLAVKNSFKAFEEQLLEFVEYIKPTERDNSSRLKAITHIQDILTLKLYTFGSFSNKLYLPHSDLDLFILAEKPSKRQQVEILRGVNKELQRKRIMLDPLFLPHARIPLLKFKDKHFKFDVDLSVQTIDILDTQVLVSEYLESFPDLKNLVLIIKHFLFIHKLNCNATNGNNWSKCSLIFLRTNY